MAPGLDTFAESTSLTTLAAINQGAQLYDSDTAEGRCVQLPWGADAFDINALNTEGKTIMERAIEWAAGIDEGCGPIISTDSDAILGGLSFTDIDLVKYDATNYTASLFFDGSLTTLSADIDAVHVLDNSHIMLSTNSSTTLGGVSFGGDDLVDYDPVADTATLIFDGSILFDGPNENIISVHIGTGSGTRQGATNMYWTDTNNKKIEHSDLDGSNREELVITGMDKPRCIDLDISTFT